MLRTILQRVPRMVSRIERLGSHRYRSNACACWRSSLTHSVNSKTHPGSSSTSERSRVQSDAIARTKTTKSLLEEGKNMQQRARHKMTRLPQHGSASFPSMMMMIATKNFAYGLLNGLILKNLLAWAINQFIKCVYVPNLF